MKTTAFLTTLCLALCGLAHAQSVALSGMLGGKALLIVDGGPPKTRHTVRVGEAPASVGGGGAQGGSRIVLSAGQGGHYFTQGQINDRTVQFVVDTGATSIAISVADAERIGLKYKSGEMIRMSTANGIIPGWRMQLASVRVGDVVVYGVEAVVSSGAMPYVLLGNSFLSRFQTTTNNGQMVLEKRY